MRDHSRACKTGASRMKPSLSRDGESRSRDIYGAILAHETYMAWLRDRFSLQCRSIYIIQDSFSLLIQPPPLYTKLYSAIQLLLEFCNSPHYVDWRMQFFSLANIFKVSNNFPPTMFDFVQYILSKPQKLHNFLIHFLNK